MASFTDNSFLYQVAFEWTKTHIINNWQYTIHTAPPPSVGNPEDNFCVNVNYDTKFALPQFVEDVLRFQDFQIHIDKQVCVDVDNVKVQEIVRTSHLPFISDFHVAVTYTWCGGKLCADLDLNYRFPWYFIF